MTIWQQHDLLLFFFLFYNTHDAKSSKENLFQNVFIWKCDVTPTFSWSVSMCECVCSCVHTQSVHGLTAFLPAYTCRTMKSPIIVCVRCQCCVDLRLCCFCMLCLYMWPYSICFIFCTLVNPTVPVAWLFVGSVCVCVCACVASEIFFYRGYLCYEPVWMLSCVPILSFPEHCDTSGKTQTHWANARDKDLLSWLFLFFFYYVFNFSILWFGLRCGVEKVKKQKKLLLFSW